MAEKNPKQLFDLCILFKWDTEIDYRKGKKLLIILSQFTFVAEKEKKNEIEKGKEIEESLPLGLCLSSFLVHFEPNI